MENKKNEKLIIEMVLAENIIKPTKSHKSDAGWDIYSPIDFVSEAHNITDRIDLGVKVEIPDGYVGIIKARSSMGKNGLETLGNVIDAGYTGFIHTTIANHSDFNINYYKGDRICQLLIVPSPEVEFVVVDKLNNTPRGENGHGSTGK